MQVKSTQPKQKKTTKTPQKANFTSSIFWQNIINSYFLLRQMLLKEKRGKKSLSLYENFHFRKLGLHSQHKLTYNSTLDQLLKCSL